MDQERPEYDSQITQASSLEHLRQEYISQPDIPEAELEVNKPKDKLYFDKGQRLKIMAGMVIATFALAIVLLVASGAWNRYSEQLSNDVIYEEPPAELELELEPDPIIEEAEFSLPDGESYTLPLPEEYILPAEEPLPTPPVTEE